MDGAFHRLGRPVRVAVGGRCLEFFNVTARRTVNRESAGVRACSRGLELSGFGREGIVSADGMSLTIITERKIALELRRSSAGSYSFQAARPLLQVTSKYPQ